MVTAETRLGASRTAVASLARHRAALVVVGAFAVGLLIAVRARRFVLYDDAAIAMRYAFRIAHGSGWTYNDLDRTNGASAPLFTLILAGASWIGADLEHAAKVIGCLCYAASIGLVAFLTTRVVGAAAGALAAVFLIASVDYQTQALSGMESALAVVLGLAVLAMLLEGCDTWAGVFLGLALFNKLDAGLLAVAVAVVFLVVMRRPPWRIVAISAAVVAPWIVFSTAYFGSPLPYSMTQKLTTGGNPASAYDPGWIVDALRADAVIPIALLALAAMFAVPALARTKPRAALVLGACVGWGAVHGVVYSVLDLGDPYPWYKTVIFPPMAIGAACALGFAARAARGTSRPIVLAVIAAVVLVGLGLPANEFAPLRAVGRTVLHGHRPDDYEAFEATRRKAGSYLARIAGDDDVIKTCYGWIAYEATEHPIKETCPLNTRRRVGAPRWLVVISFPGVLDPSLPRGASIRKTFTSDVGVGGATYVIELARPARS